MKQKQSDEFKNFDAVMSGLLAVPYSELQKKIEAEKRTKAQRKKRAKPSPASHASAARKS